MEPNLTNIHPADELAALREEIKQMASREDELRAILLKEDADLTGNQYQAFIQPSTRETIDKNAIIAELGKEAVQKFIKTSVYRTVKLVPRNTE